MSSSEARLDWKLIFLCVELWCGQIRLFLQIVLPSEAPRKVRKSPCCEKFLGAADDWESETEESRISRLLVPRCLTYSRPINGFEAGEMVFFVSNLLTAHDCFIFLWSLRSFINFRDPSLKFPFWCLHSSLFAALKWCRNRRKTASGWYIFSDRALKLSA